MQIAFSMIPVSIRLLLIVCSAGCVGGCVGGLLSAADGVQQSTAEQLQFFETKVRPVLVEHCYSCHSVNAKKVQAGLLLDSRSALLRGGDSGAALVPGDADASLLIEAVRYESYEMPPKGKLDSAEITALEQWVAKGAAWPDEAMPESETGGKEFDLRLRAQEHWAWQPIIAAALPPVTDQEWPRRDLDHFVLAKLEQTNLHPAADADRLALLRRLYFDLIGLPPTPDQVQSFVNDSAPNGIDRVVDELLESPHFGERWGRHWLDLVRYAESRGHEFDNDSSNAYQYRDYIIRAFNADVPYDQLIREHIAGDLITSPRLNPDQGFNESILGTGFWFLGEWAHSPVDIRKDESDRFDNMIDVMSKTFLGVTVACARCHDHKFDAISTADYYSLSGFLQGSEYRQVRFDSMEHNRAIAAALSTLDHRYQVRIEQLLGQAGLAFDIPESLSQDSVTDPARPVPATPSQVSGEAKQVLVNYADVQPAEFIQDGYVFGDRPRRAGQPYLATVDGQPTIQFAALSAAVSDSFWDGLESASEPLTNERSALAKLPSSGRTLRTPSFQLTDGQVSCRVRGTGHVFACVDSHRLVAGPLHGETLQAIRANDPWVRLNLSRYIGHRLHLEFIPDVGASLEVALVMQGASSQEQQSITQNEKRAADAVAVFAAAADETIGRELNEVAKAWSVERAELQSKIMRRSRLAIAMWDGTGEDDRILIRGNSSKPGDVEPRHFLTAISGNQPLTIPQGSGRMELAMQIADSQNPLTSRVIVNRVWHHLIGRGIVPTTDDFGVLGQRPTHPELLDHLATQFLGGGQSIKSLIRMIVLSRTYQMSSHIDQAAASVDPKNELWHHLPPKRLEGEVIRDALLMVSGQWDPELFGQPIPIHLTAFMDGRGRPNRSGPLDGDNRRSIYTSVRRNFLSPFMLAFDTPVPFSTMGRRNVSNVPAQALILMNDPLVTELANKWATRAIASAATPQSRIQWMYQSAFARSATETELQFADTFLTTQASERNLSIDEVELWAELAHALINTKEFIFLR